MPALCIAGTHSDCGKTTVSLGIMAALVRRGLKVQAFKIGPDFIDPGHHRRITGRDSHNLDSWVMDRGRNRQILSRNLLDADVAVLEGVMGLFDGFSGRNETGSTALMAKWLDLPVVLVVDARSMARSAAAVALGYARFDRELSLRGVLFNRVASGVHAEMLREAMESVSGLPPVFGCLPRDQGLEMPSRHLGLVTDEDFTLNEERRDRLGRWIEGNLDLDRLLSSLGGVEITPVPAVSRGLPRIRIGIARDEAFCFYYPENLRLLEDAGAELVAFSPLHAKELPGGLRGIILGGGYPELHCKALSENREMLSSLRTFAMDGGPVYAECGGFMYLMEKIADLEGRAYPMVGLFPMTARMESRLHSLGYREIITVKESLLGPPGTRVRGHEFHFSRIEDPTRGIERIYSMLNRMGPSQGEEGFLLHRVLGSYVHLHWGSNPEVARQFVDYCEKRG
ncbi:MAG: cobyrinate a,c-diamide synthase [Deltaproteobacteria bacterium]|nr:cobyrinate a,c-diamide synthase [Deltaproteobacteria bacterium]